MAGAISVCVSACASKTGTTEQYQTVRKPLSLNTRWQLFPPSSIANKMEDWGFQTLNGLTLPLDLLQMLNNDDWAAREVAGEPD